MLGGREDNAKIFSGSFNLNGRPGVFGFVANEGGGMLFVSGSTPWIAGVAIFLATINVAGGFLVTHRMLKMFRKE